MTIKHARLSGVANPADPDLFGGEDWDADHEQTGPVAVGAAWISFATGGAIGTQYNHGLGFSKTATGTYRATIDLADYNALDPLILANVSVPTGAPRFTRASVAIDGPDYYIEVKTIDAAGDLVDIASGRLYVVAYSVF
jgi:hypothetical protein